MNHTRATKKESDFILQDLAIIFLSILVTVILVKTGILSSVLLSTNKLRVLGSFIAGMFFTTVFTTAPAITALGSIAQNHSIVLNAFFGAIGAVIGDVIIFQFVKDRLSEHLVELLGHNTLWRRFKALFRMKYFRWLTFFIGGMLIASPLPDELGIGVLGFSKMKLSIFIPLSLFFNFVGIALIGLVARAF